MITTTDPSQLPEASHHDSPDAHTTIGYCRCCGENGEAECPHCHSHQFQCDPPENSAHKLMDKFRQLLMHAGEQKNSKFYIGIILIATGDPANGGVSITDYAANWGVTKAHVSRLCGDVCSYLGIAPPPSMRGEHTKESFRQSNYRKN
jgi:hypothetical protein